MYIRNIELVKLNGLWTGKTEQLRFDLMVHQHALDLVFIRMSFSKRKNSPKRRDNLNLFV